MQISTRKNLQDILNARNIEIIGEATNRILKEDIIWSIVVNHLPKLRTEVESFLGQE